MPYTKLIDKNRVLTAVAGNSISAAWGNEFQDQCIYLARGFTSVYEALAYCTEGGSPWLVSPQESVILQWDAKLDAATDKNSGVTAMCSDGRHLYVLEGTNRYLTAYRCDTGAKVWQYDNVNAMTGYVCTDGVYVFAAGDTAAEILRLACADGAVEEHQAYEVGCVATGAMHCNGQWLSVVDETHDSLLGYSLDAAGDLSYEWAYNWDAAGARIKAVHCGEMVTLIGGEVNATSKISAMIVNSTGAASWTLDAGDYATGTPIVEGIYCDGSYIYLCHDCIENLAGGKYFNVGKISFAGGIVAVTPDIGVGGADALGVFGDGRYLYLDQSDRVLIYDPVTMVEVGAQKTHAAAAAGRIVCSDGLQVFGWDTSGATDKLKSYYNGLFVRQYVTASLGPSLECRRRYPIQGALMIPL